MSKLFFMLFILIVSSISLENSEEKQVIKVALYDSISPSIYLLEKSLHYGWIADKEYIIEVERIGYKDVINGLGKYDVLVIGASGRQYFHALNPKWKENVLRFIKNGGGYIGICGGANIASKGYEKPRFLLDFIK